MSDFFGPVHEPPRARAVLGEVETFLSACEHAACRRAIDQNRLGIGAANTCVHPLPRLPAIMRDRDPVGNPCVDVLGPVAVHGDRLGFRHVPARDDPERLPAVRRAQHAVQQRHIQPRRIARIVRQRKRANVVRPEVLKVFAVGRAIEAAQQGSTPPHYAPLPAQIHAHIEIMSQLGRADPRSQKCQREKK